MPGLPDVYPRLCLSFINDPISRGSCNNRICETLCIQQWLTEAPVEQLSLQGKYWGGSVRFGGGSQGQLCMHRSYVNVSVPN